MYRITDPHHPDIAKHIRQAVSARLVPYPTSSVYALIDATLSPEWAQQVWHAAQSQPEDVQSVYQDTPLAGLEECSLFVARIDNIDLEPLLQRGQAGPMLSFVQSTLGLEALRQHLARFARARTTDGQWLVARWGCPVVAPALLHALTPAQRSYFVAGFAAWYLINRQGTLDVVQGSMDAVSAAAAPDIEGLLEHGYAMNDEAFAHVVDAGEADGLLSSESNTSSRLIRSVNPSQLHSMAVRMLAAMTRLGVEDPSLRRQWLIPAMECPTEAQALAFLTLQAAGLTPSV